MKYNVDYEIASIVFMCVFYIFYSWKDVRKNKQSIAYKQLIFCVLVTNVLDVLSAWTIDGTIPVPVGAVYFVNIVYCVMCIAVSIAFVNYFIVVLDRKSDEYFQKIYKRLKVICIVYLALVLTTPFTSAVFSIGSDGAYRRGVFFAILYIVPVLVVTQGILIIRHADGGLKKEMRLYCVIFFAGAALCFIMQEIACPRVLLSNFGVVIACVMLYFSVQTPGYLMLIKTTEDLKREKEKAEVSARAKDTFLANMSHEVRTPINAVIGMNEMILRESEEDNIRKYSNEISKASKTLLALVNDILDYTKIESGKMNIVPVKYDVGKLFRDAISMLRGKFKEKNLALQAVINPDMPAYLFGDDVRIKQILINLLNNAVKYTEKGKVMLNATCVYNDIDPDVKEVWLKITISDTGIGIKSEDLEYIFDDFKRLELERNRTIEGTGIGLAVVKMLVEQMNGKIDIQSEYGVGSRFEVMIPQKVMSKETIRTARKKKSADTSTSSKEGLFTAPDVRILAVDDNRVNLTVIECLLKRTQVKMDLALSGRECLKKIEENDGYDAVFLDHMMPEMDGITTLNEIRKGKYKKMPVIVMTANAVNGSRQMYMDAGFDEYISKPIDGDELEKILKRFLDKKIARK